MKEYLDPTDWSLKLVNVDNDAAQPDWIEVPAGDAILALAHDGLFSLWINGQQYACRDGRLRKSGYHDNFEYWCKKWSAKIIWRRQKPRVRVYATLSQSKFKRDLQALKGLLIEERPILEALRSVLDKVITEAADDPLRLARKQILQDWPSGGFTVRYVPFEERERRLAANKLALEEWQPDWTQAPKGCDWFAVDSDGTGTFMNYEPEMLCGTWVAPSSTTHPIIKARPGTNFGYQGDWRDSLRKCKKIGGVIIL